MPTSRLARFVFLPILLMAMAGVIGVAAVVFRQGLAAGAAGTWLMAWVLAFTIGLPVAMLVLPLLTTVAARWARARNVPHSGRRILGAGQ